MLSHQYLENSESKYNDALGLAERHSYGVASSLLIISLEETTKALVLHLDGMGFEFRSRVTGIKSLFENHELRYFLAAILSVMQLFSEDIVMFIDRFRKGDRSFYGLLKNDPLILDQLFKYVRRKSDEIKLEANWFSNADLYRQEGFYVDFRNELKSPLLCSKEECLQVKMRIERFRKFANDFMESFSNNDVEIVEHIRKLKIQFREGWYEELSKLVLKTKDGNYDPFKEISAMFSELDGDLNGNAD